MKFNMRVWRNSFCRQKPRTAPDFERVTLLDLIPLLLDRLKMSENLIRGRGETGRHVGFGESYDIGVNL